MISLFCFEGLTPLVPNSPEVKIESQIVCKWLNLDVIEQSVLNISKKEKVELSIKQLNHLMNIAEKVDDENDSTFNVADLVESRSSTTSFLFHSFYGDSDITESAKELDAIIFDIQKKHKWLRVVSFVFLYILFPPTAIYFFFVGYKKGNVESQKLKTLTGKCETLIFKIKDKYYQ